MDKLNQYCCHFMNHKPQMEQDLKLFRAEIETLETKLTKVEAEMKSYLQELGLN